MLQEDAIKSFIVISLAIMPLLIVAVIGRERVLALVFGPIETKPINFGNLTLTPNPNQFLVCPANYCSAKAHLVSSTYPVSVDTLQQRWLSFLETQPRLEKGAADDEAKQYDYIQRTSIMRYPDSITVKFIDLDDARSTLAIYSRSHYGRSDFGVNERRIKSWLSALSD